ncbi:hypothetical protein P4O66_000447 [Electrophorus voltai]|uniref:Uncharacterized protein n=1 Tax=Electrophorus voltai TaxID=2609070 RepID=A0AAD8ZID7_9TELE|nr:hypothetical protein P4O66_000447 [Electrophorus voltai]
MLRTVVATETTNSQNFGRNFTFELQIKLDLLLTGYVMYSGLLTEIHIRTGSPPIGGITVAYKYKEGPYKECGMLFSESGRIAPKLPTVGVFYDDPKKVPGSKCRCVVGSILSEGDETPATELQQLYEKCGFRLFTFPEVTHVVSACFPHRTFLSIYLGVWRVYPRLARYIKVTSCTSIHKCFGNGGSRKRGAEDPAKNRKLCAHPFLEIYKGRLIHYMGPLARQGDFYVPEVQESPRRPQEGEESEEERRTDISGADSYSECSSVSYPHPSDSRDQSRTRDQEQDRDRDSDPFEHSESDSDGQSNSSASSFEELDLEKDRVKPENKHTPDHSADEELSPQKRRMVVEGEESWVSPKRCKHILWKPPQSIKSNRSKSTRLD